MVTHPPSTLSIADLDTRGPGLGVMGAGVSCRRALRMIVIALLRVRVDAERQFEAVLGEVLADAVIGTPSGLYPLVLSIANVDRLAVSAAAVGTRGAGLAATDGGASQGGDGKTGDNGEELHVDSLVWSWLWLLD